MTPEQGWTPAPAPANGLISASGLFQPHLWHRIQYGAAPYRLDSQNAVDLGYGGKYVVLALCGRMCVAEVADGVTESQDECSDCWRLTSTTTTAEPADADWTPRCKSADATPKWPSESPDFVSRPAAVHPPPGALPLGHRPIHGHQLAARAEPRGDTACITSAARTERAASGHHHAA